MLPSLILVSGVLAFDERKGGTVMKIEFFFLVVAVSAGITFFLRALPFLAFRGERKMPETDLSWKNPAISNYGCADCVLFKGNRE